MSRYFADRFDANGRFYVFDELFGGSQVAGPFGTLKKAQRAADYMNKAKGNAR